MNPALLTRPETAPKAKKANKTKSARKVWTGARKKLSVSHLQLTLPGIGGQAL